jgi:hypothetical protein
MQFICRPLNLEIAENACKYTTGFYQEKNVMHLKGANFKINYNIVSIA